jgi:hypothetical protein
LNICPVVYSVMKFMREFPDDDAALFGFLRSTGGMLAA